MNRLSRRAFLAGTAAAVSMPAFAAVPASSDVDVVIVGAGAAGIAAARRLMTLGRRVAIVEASERIGGRCITDMTTFGVPYDRGAHWLHMPDINPVAKLARGTGLEVYPAPSGQKLRVGRRSAREGELEDYLSWSVRSSRAISDAGRATRDVSAAQALPKDLVDWRATIEFVLGPFGCGKDLDQSFRRATSRVRRERDTDSFCRQGFGTLLAKLADDVPVRFAAQATRINALTDAARSRYRDQQGNVAWACRDRDGLDGCARPRERSSSSRRCRSATLDAAREAGRSAPTSTWRWSSPASARSRKRRSRLREGERRAHRWPPCKHRRHIAVHGRGCRASIGR